MVLGRRAGAVSLQGAINGQQLGPGQVWQQEGTWAKTLQQMEHQWDGKQEPPQI